jgi:membrane protein DedA with SNARE-associated domain
MRPVQPRPVPPGRLVVTIVVAMVVLSLVAGWAGDLLFASLVDRHPLALIALSPRNRNLALTTNALDAASYYGVGFARLVFSDPFYFLLGRWYGDRAIAWAERRSRTYGPFVRDGERWFSKLAYPLVFAAPNNIICSLAGATGMRPAVFLILNGSGTVARLVAIRVLGATFESPLSGIVDFIGRYRTPILILSALAVAWTIFGELRGDNSELKTLAELEHDALDPDGEAEGSPDPTGREDDPTP